MEGATLHTKSQDNLELCYIYKQLFLDFPTIARPLNIQSNKDIWFQQRRDRGVCVPLFQDIGDGITSAHLPGSSQTIYPRHRCQQ